MTQSGWHGVDLDGTLAEDMDTFDPEVIGPPVEAMVRRVQDWLANGEEVRIVTARVSSMLTRQEINAATRLIQTWTLGYIGTRLPVTAEKDFLMIDLYDDRAVRVEHNTGRILARAYDHAREVVRQRLSRNIARLTRLSPSQQNALLESELAKAMADPEEPEPEVIEVLRDGLAETGFRPRSPRASVAVPQR